MKFLMGSESCCLNPAAFSLMAPEAPEAPPVLAAAVAAVALAVVPSFPKSVMRP